MPYNILRLYNFNINIIYTYVHKKYINIEIYQRLIIQINNILQI